MNHPIVESSVGVTLVGGGPVSAALLRLALARAPRLVGADGGADRILALGHEPEAVVGDLDSITPAARTRLAGRLFPLTEQVTTDFDKALRSIQAPFVLAVGFAGARMDHGLAVLTGLVAHPDRVCLLLGPQDVVFLAPPPESLTALLQDSKKLKEAARDAAFAALRENPDNVFDAHAGAPILIAVSAPTAHAVELADEAGITLIALARSDRFEVFSHSDRLTEVSHVR